MEQREQILEKAEQLFMKVGIKSVSMDDLARHLGVSKKTLYQYFENKSDLVHKVLEAHIEREQAHCLTARDNSENAIAEMLEVTKFVLAHLRDLSPTTVYDLQKYYQPIYAMMENHHKRETVAQIEDNIVRGQKEGLYRKDVHPGIVARMYSNSSFLIVDEDIFPLREYDRETLLMQFVLHHIRGMATEKGLEFLEKNVRRERAN